MVQISQTVSKKSKNIENELEPDEKGSLLPFIPEFLVDSFKKGRVEGKAEGVAEGEKRGEKRGMEKRYGKSATCIHSQKPNAK
jgi:hypothetical protein